MGNEGVYNGKWRVVCVVALTTIPPAWCRLSSLWYGLGSQSASRSRGKKKGLFGPIKHQELLHGSGLVTNEARGGPTLFMTTAEGLV